MCLLICVLLLHGYNADTCTASNMLIPAMPENTQPCGALMLPQHFHLYRFCYDRLSSLLKTLEITNTDDFLPVQLVADFGTLLGTYSRGFAVIIEPFDERLPHIPDPVLQLR